MKLSKRLAMVAGMITKGHIVCDIGTDHGYIPIFMVQNDFSPCAYACDVNEGPLAIATQNIAANNLEDRISCILSDGLKEVADKIDSTNLSIVIAGMGGLLIKRILADDISFAKASGELILSPHSEIVEVRHFLLDNGFLISDEDMVLEDGKFYTVIKATTKAYSDEKTNVEEYSAIDYMFGKKLLDSCNPVLYQFILKELDTAKKIIENLTENGKEGSSKRIEEISQKVEYLNEAKKRYGEN